MKTNPATKLGIALAGVLALVLLHGRVHAGAPQYTVTVLGDLTGTSSQAFGINASGQVVGRSYLAGNIVRHAVVWTGTTPADLGTLGGNNSTGYSINDSGLVAGSANTAGGGSHAAVWTGTTPTDLGTLGGTGSRCSDGDERYAKCGECFHGRMAR